MTPGRRSAAPRSGVLPARSFQWRGVALERYRDRAGAITPRVLRQVLIAGSRGAPTAFDVRYFELAAGGRTNFELHRHAHVVIALRGSGRVRLGGRWLRVGRLDACYVAPDTPHELHNDRRRPFGFLCIVDAQRDRGRPPKPSSRTGGRNTRGSKRKGRS